MNLGEGEQNSPKFRKKNLVGKVPVLEHEGNFLFESGAIARYVASTTESDLYPKDYYTRALVDQWLDFFTCHLGRWLNTMFFEKKY